MVVAPTARERAAVEADHEEDSRRQSRPGASPGLRIAMVALLALLLVASVVAMTVGIVKYRSTNEQLHARAQVVRAAEQFAVAANNYGPESVDKYQSSVDALMSTKFKAQFDKVMQQVLPQVQQYKMTSQGRVLAAGVSTIDADSAKVLVVADADVKTSYDQRQRHFRWEVSLVKVDGRWLVDDFNPVA